MDTISAPMLDWWTIPGRMYGVKNLDFKVELVPDVETRPDPSEDYSERDEELFDQGEWGFAKVRVIPVGGADLTDHVYATETLNGIAWGQFAESRIDRWELFECPLRDMAEAAARRMRASGLDVEVEPGSGFALEAPF